MSSHRRVTTAAVVFVAIASLGVLPTNATVGAARDRHWIALGDSYSSGEGIPGTIKSTDNYKQADCRRATGVGTDATAWAEGAYQRVHDALGFSSIDFVACTGALADDAGAQIAEADAKTGHTSWDLATFSFGGDNIGFPGVIKGCLDINGWGFFDLTPGCDVTEEQLRSRIDMLVGKKPIGAGYTGKTTLPELYDTVAKRITPGGNVVVLGYPNIVEEVSRWDSWRRDVIGNCEGIQSYDIAMLRSAAGYLNQQTALAVQAADRRYRGRGVRFTFDDISRKVYETGDRADQRHALCAKTPWLNGETTGVSSGDWRLSRSFHPMQVGHTATASDLAQVLRYDIHFGVQPPPSSIDESLTAAVQAVDQEVPQLKGLVAGPPEGGTGDAAAATLYRDGVNAGTAVFIYGVAASNMNLLDWSNDTRAACDNRGLWDALQQDDFGCSGNAPPGGPCAQSLLDAFDARAPSGATRNGCTSYAGDRWAVVNLVSGVSSSGWYWRDLTGTWEPATSDGP